MSVHSDNRSLTGVWAGSCVPKLELANESEQVIYAKLGIKDIICIVIFKNHEKRTRIFEKVGDELCKEKKTSLLAEQRRVYR